VHHSPFKDSVSWWWNQEKTTVTVKSSWEELKRWDPSGNPVILSEKMCSICQLGGLYSEKLWPNSWKCCARPQAWQHFQVRGHSFQRLTLTIKYRFFSSLSNHVDSHWPFPHTHNHGQKYNVGKSGPCYEPIRLQDSLSSLFATERLSVVFQLWHQILQIWHKGEVQGKV